MIIASNQLTQTQQLELVSIRQDAEFLSELVIQLNSHQSSGILAPSIVPFSSLFTIESYKYFQENFPSQALSLSAAFEPVIRESRLRTKFFEDKKQRVEGIFDLLEWISEFHEEWHINGHSGLLSFLKKALQNDLGIFYYSGRIVGSTHTDLLNLGYRKGDLPTKSKAISTAISPLSHSFGQELGRYAANVLSLLEIASTSQRSETRFSYRIQDHLLGYKDVKSRQFLSHVFNGASNRTVNLALLAFLSQVNFLLYVVRNLMTNAPYTICKMEYITIYHLCSSLKKLQEYGYRDKFLTEHSKQHLQEIINNKELKRLAKEVKFRNTLIHYKIDDVPESKLDPSKHLYGLVEYFFDGMQYPEFASLVSTQLIRVSEILEAWLDFQVKRKQIQSWW